MRRFQPILLDKCNRARRRALGQVRSSRQVQKACAVSLRSDRFFSAGTHSRSVRRLALLYLPSNLRKNSVKRVMLSAPAERIVRTFVPVKRNARALYPVRNNARPSRLCREKCTVAPLRRLLSHSRPMRAAASSVDEFAEAAPQGRAARRRTRAGSGECARTPLFAFGTPAGRWQGSRSPDVA